MYNIQVKEAKMHFIKTGRLNKKIVNEEISKSWYRCFITHLNSDEPIRSKSQKDSLETTMSNEMIENISRLVDHNYDYLICDTNGDVLFKNIIHDVYDVINHVDETLIGTNAAAISLRTEKYTKVSLEEHYLNVFSNLYTVAMPISLKDIFYGVCMIISDVNLSEYDVHRFQESLKKMKIDSKLIVHKENKTNYRVDKLFAYPESYLANFEMNIKRLLEYRMPIFIMGSKGSGKTTLALYLAEQISKSRILINVVDIPRKARYDELLTGLYQFDTVIIENFELLDSKSIALLIVYTEEKIIANLGYKYSDFKCYNIILTTVYTSVNALAELNINQRLLSRIKQNSIVLKNLYDFTDDYCKLVKKIIDNNDVNCTPEYIDKLINKSEMKNFKEIVLDVQLSELNNRNVSVYSVEHLSHLQDENLLSLDEMEAKYIQKVLTKVDYNLTLAAEIIGIGRSTLYRKLEKYQIETKIKKK
ncbi:helix-turn-helix domain-containing protein [Fusibacter sp. 3D3]|uniref:helix-turn-helix domain-containing protein n=1 Tax=Fusibacter sp. 3D3 TaxID=1048380 RepID=UPI000853B19D|nr:helix-turn-helix domain-containing protein [Fusibacter sp. 3D3]GAU75779.1 sigma-54-dependent transcriptionalactivator [Fusibacter sp. 3D3]